MNNKRVDKFDDLVTSEDFGENDGLVKGREKEISSHKNP